MFQAALRKFQKRQNVSLCSCLYKSPAGCFKREQECLCQTAHAQLPVLRRWALNRRGKKPTCSESIEVRVETLFREGEIPSW